MREISKYSDLLLENIIQVELFAIKIISIYNLYNNYDHLNCCFMLKSIANFDTKKKTRHFSNSPEFCDKCPHSQKRTQQFLSPACEASFTSTTFPFPSEVPEFCPGMSSSFLIFANCTS